jgi:predicted ATPase/class 3 adenylate cyclase
MRRDLPAGTVTFLFTDIEGSTRLLHSLGPDAYAEALAEHRRLLRDSFAAHSGVEVDTQGDAFFVAFPTATGAADAARTAQYELGSGRISVRMGLHTGTPTVTGEGYIGIDVHRGARVGALAHGGQIVCSPATMALLDGRELRDLGLHRLKDFDGAIRLYQLGSGAFPAVRTPGSVDLPTPTTRFLGRERELFEAVSLVYERDPRALTILGPGGTGKTRFALELARLLAEDAEGGTVFCALAPLRDSDLVLATIADRLGAGSADVEGIAARIGERRTHVVCDNLEHLLPDAARALGELTAAAPGLRLLTTSREPLRIQGESELDLPPLADAEASALFIERAHAVRPDLSLDEHVTELCARLDHLPLAVELAAARTKLLSPEALLERLDARLDLLKGTRDADERHSTLRATIAWSHDLLDEDERRLFRRLAVFRGGCTLETAEAVCGADLDTLASLLDKSLVRRRTGRLGEQRFWMLETIREFAVEQLDASGEAADIRRRHADRMLELALSAHLSEDDAQPFRQDLALAEREDLRAALDWGAEHDPEHALELGVALENFWSAHAPAEGVQRLTDLLRRHTGGSRRLRARGFRVLAGAAHQLRDWEVTDASYADSLRLFTEIDDELGVASVKTRLAYRAFPQDEKLARRLLEESEHLAHGRLPVVEAINAGLFAWLALDEGRFDESETQVRRGLEFASALEWTWWEASALRMLGEISLRRGDADTAVEHLRGALRLSVTEESTIFVLGNLASLARVARQADDVERAALLWGVVCAEGERLPGWDERRAVLSDGALDDLASVAHASFGRGRALDLDEAVGIALGELELPQTEP